MRVAAPRAGAVGLAGRWVMVGRAGWVGLLLLSMMATGCAITPIDHSRAPPADWPVLAQRVELRNGLAEVCRIPGLHFGTNVGCAVIDFERRTCTIYMDARHASGEVLAHEKAHCRGYDHPGEQAVRLGWEAHKTRLAARRAAGAQARSAVMGDLRPAAM